MQRYDDAVDTGTFSRTDERTEIVRVFNFVENKNKRRLILSLSDGKNFFYLGIAVGIDYCNDTL